MAMQITKKKKKQKKKKEKKKKEKNKEKIAIWTFYKVTSGTLKHKFWPNLVLAKLGLAKVGLGQSSSDQTWTWPNLVSPMLVIAHLHVPRNLRIGGDGRGLPDENLTSTARKMQFRPFLQCAAPGRSSPCDRGFPGIQRHPHSNGRDQLWPNRCLAKFGYHVWPNQPTLSRPSLAKTKFGQMWKNILESQSKMSNFEGKLRKYKNVKQTTKL